MNKKKKKIIKIAIISVIAILVIISIIYIISLDTGHYDENDIVNTFTKYYMEEGLVSKERNYVMDYFGLEVKDDSSIVLLSNFDVNNDEVSNSSMLLLYYDNLDNDKLDEYYNNLKTFVDVKIDSSKDIEKELYSKAIIKKDNHYLYLIIGSDSKLMEKELNFLYIE